MVQEERKLNTNTKKANFFIITKKNIFFVVCLTFQQIDFAFFAENYMRLIIILLPKANFTPMHQKSQLCKRL